MCPVVLLDGEKEAFWANSIKLDVVTTPWKLACCTGNTALPILIVLPVVMLVGKKDAFLVKSVKLEIAITPSEIVCSTGASAVPISMVCAVIWLDEANDASWAKRVKFDAVSSPWKPTSGEQDAFCANSVKLEVLSCPSKLIWPVLPKTAHACIVVLLEAEKDALLAKSVKLDDVTVPWKIACST